MLTLLAQIPPIFAWPAGFCLLTIFWTWSLAVATSNVGQIDRIWAVLPVIFSAYFALLPFWPSDKNVPMLLGWPLSPYTPVALEKRLRSEFSPRAVLMLLLIVLWSIRLNYNAWRRGVFKWQEEDYRWAVIRKGMHPIIFQLFNFFFIAVVQSILLMSLSFPVYLAVKGSHEALTTADYALFVTGLVVLGVEGTADNQQYAYQTFKRMFLEREKKFNDSDVTKVSLPASAHWPFAMMAYSASDARRGFITKGLWAWSRHPNFLCEQTFWVLIALFPILGSTGAKPLPAMVPALALIVLFFGSTLFTEKITQSKYPEAYRQYQKRVGMIFPIPWGWLLGERERASVDRAVWGGKEE